MTQDFQRHLTLNTCLRPWKLLFHQTLFLVLIVSSLFRIFDRCAGCFQFVNEHRVQEYSKYRAYLTLLNIAHNNNINTKININYL